MKAKLITTFLFVKISLFCYCQIQQELNTPKLFTAPRIAEILEKTKVLKNASSITISHPVVECVGSFVDSIYLTSKYDPKDTSINWDVEQRSDGLQLFVDTTQKITLTQDKIHGLYYSEDTSQANYSGFSCFVYNESPRLKWLQTEDLKVIAIQEAMDTNYSWRPIEIWQWSFCGVRYHKVPIKPYHFLLFKVPLYQGKYYTRLRLKLYTDDATYYSNEYMGYINYKQFNLSNRLKKGFNLSFLNSR